MSEYTEQMKHYPEVVEFIVETFGRPLEDVAMVEYSANTSRLGLDGIINQTLI